MDLSENNSRNAAKTDENGKKLAFRAKAVLCVILFVLTFTFFSFGLVMLIYTPVLTAATKSAMVFFFAAGLCFLSIGAALTLVIPSTKLLTFFKPMLIKKLAPFSKTKEDEKPTKYATSSLIITILGAIMIILSAILGSIQKENWTNSFANFRAENGYSAEAETRQIGFSAEDFDKIILDLTSKNSVIIYEEDLDIIRVSFNLNYENDVTLSKNGSRLIVSEAPSPKKDGALEKMLFFVFTPSKNEAQIKIYLPSKYKNAIEIEGTVVYAHT